ncbi:MAG: hypothetical protein AB7D36_00615 [Oscillospiraceae bacterium]
MGSTISAQQFIQLRNEFRKYLLDTRPDWNESTVSTHYSDAFFAYNNNVGVDFWHCFTSEEALIGAKEKIENYLTSVRSARRSAEGANGYYRSMKYLKSFLDERHPGLASEWSGKAMGDTYLKNAFQNWMSKQRKSNGELYKSGTIRAYTNALKKSTSKLSLGENVLNDLFYYVSSDEFEEARKIILAAPNFDEVDLRQGIEPTQAGWFSMDDFSKNSASRPHGFSRATPNITMSAAPCVILIRLPGRLINIQSK